MQRFRLVGVSKIEFVFSQLIEQRSHFRAVFLRFEQPQGFLQQCIRFERANRIQINLGLAFQRLAAAKGFVALLKNGIGGNKMVQRRIEFSP